MDGRRLGAGRPLTRGNDGPGVFLHGLPEKERLVQAARRRLNGEDHKSGGCPVDAMDRREVLPAERPFQAHEQGFLHRATGGNDGEKGEVARDDERVVLEPHRFIERDARFVGERTVTVDRSCGR